MNVVDTLRSGGRLAPGLGLAIALAASALLPGAGVAQSAHGAASGASLPPGTILVDVVGLHSRRGHIACALFHGSHGFPSDRHRAVQGQRVTIHGTWAVCRFSHVPAGVYAVSVLHDENDNGHMDTGLFGIPSEGYGASNDAHRTFGPPSWDDAKFRFQGPPLRLTIHMRY